MEFVGDARKLRRRALILPALSIGNAGQLAIDLLVSTYRAPRIGFLDDPCVLPCVGNDPFGPEPQGRLAVSVELYVDSVRDVTLLQQRSPLVKGATMKHAESIAEWARKEGFELIVILSGLDAGKRNLHYYAGPQVYYQSSTQKVADECERNGWKDVQHSELTTGQQFDFSSLRDAIDGFSEHDEYYLSKLPVTHLFSSCKEKGLDVVSLLCYCAEGDNIPDGITLASSIEKLIGKVSEGATVEWKFPLSWSTVYGAPPDLSIY